MTLRLADLPANQFGLVVLGGGATDLPLADGRRVVATGSAGLYRFPARSTGAGGSFDEGPGLSNLSQTLFPSGGHILAGQSWYFQGWYRDPAGPCGTGSNWTNGLAVAFQP